MVNVCAVDRAGIGEFSRVAEIKVGEARYTPGRYVRRDVAQELVHAQSGREELHRINLDVRLDQALQHGRVEDGTGAVADQVHADAVRAVLRDVLPEAGHDERGAWHVQHGIHLPGRRGP